MPVIPYYRLEKFHTEICGNDAPVNIRQLLKLVGGEAKYKMEDINKIDDKYIDKIPLHEFYGCRYPHTEPLTELDKVKYQWEKLELSIQRDGIKIPLIVQRIIVKNIEYYQTLEGHHRLQTIVLMKPFNPDRLIPVLVVKQDMKYTEYMNNKICQTHLHPGW